MKPSEKHKTRQEHIWLLFDNGDKKLKEYSKYINGTLVDLGCGETTYKNFFLQFADNYIGVDWANSIHDSKPDIISDLNKKIELQDEIADTLVSISVIEHLCEPQVFLNESYRILKEDGHMILQVPFQYQVHEAPNDYFRYTRYGLEYIFKKSGFKDIQISESGGFWTTIAIKLNEHSVKLLRKTKKYTIIMKIVKLLLLPFWTLNQVIALILDKLDKNPNETMSYWVIAKK